MCTALDNKSAGDEGGGGSGGGGGESIIVAISSHHSHVNTAIQQLAQKYCQDCKNAFDELSKIIQVRRQGFQGRKSKFPEIFRLRTFIAAI